MLITLEKFFMLTTQKLLMLITKEDLSRLFLMKNSWKQLHKNFEMTP